MKKRILFLILLLILVGCSKKKPKIVELSCTKSLSDSNSRVTYENKYKYEDDQLIGVKVNTTMEFTTDGISNLETFKTYAEASKDEYNKKEGTKATMSSNDTSINILVEYDILKMNEEEIENNKFNLSITDLKKKLEKDEGYTCE
jgi:uncharacterized lipoprotein YehR (DUF1307 family)